MSAIISCNYVLLPPPISNIAYLTIGIISREGFAVIMTVSLHGFLCKEV